ncbi:hypothetical protein KOR42_06600 [Thalassoglobus neptunius]|uniref:DUF2057 domain-containing protein n=1 Tax=Thalassoglobus neptunius TaxID=1938619 RepID=A0A5C5X377_9PLAN|nr:hypothetical protein [Thalassoglobus neptunius]TWT57300.1 hypothetical protein KOR42_06600 [Thalassoglobus neptunius]
MSLRICLVFFSQLLATTLWSALPASAQSIRVFTEVIDVSQPEQPQPLSHSVTYFHAGRVYDYMPDLGEVVIFEPDHHRFIILGNNYVATEVSFAEVNHFLESAEQEAQKLIGEYSKSSEPHALQNAALLQFQLNPNFQEELSNGNTQLTLLGSQLDYQVTGTQMSDSTVTQEYLDYADWTKRLNYVLHPQPTLPHPRLQLNQALRKHNLLPRTVEVTLHVEPRVKLRAVHDYSDKLQSIDRQSISRWERTLQGEEVRWMTFQEYQQFLIAQVQR